MESAWGKEWVRKQVSECKGRETEMSQNIPREAGLQGSPVKLKKWAST